MEVIIRQLLLKRVVVSGLVLLLAGQGNYFVLAQSAPAGVQLTKPSQAYTPPVLKGLYFNPNNPKDFEFIVDSGTKKQVTRQEALRLVNYFLAGLTLPADSLWVNLSPYETNRIIPPATAATELGEGLLQQDYLLKQLAASLTYPEQEPGKSYWDAIYRVCGENNFDKVWIVPGKAVVEEQNNVVMVSEANLKVMMEEDYLATAKNRESRNKKRETAGTDAFRQHILPLIEKDVNQGKNFAQLRQIYNSLILAMWFKKNFAVQLYKNYVDKEKITGIDLADKKAKEKIYNLYVKAFEDGAYNYVKRESAGGGHASIVRKITKRQYFSGGASFDGLPDKLRETRGNKMNTLAGLAGAFLISAVLIACSSGASNTGKTMDAGDNADTAGNITGSKTGTNITTGTVTSIASATVTATETPTLTNTGSMTATITGTESVTSSTTGSVTNTGTGSMAATGTESTTATATLSGTTGTGTGTGTATGTGTPTDTGSNTVTGSMTATLTATSTGSITGTGGNTGTGTTTATGTGTGTLHTPQNTLFYPDGTIMLGSGELAIAYNPPNYDYTRLYDVADGGMGDAQKIVTTGAKVVKIYLPGTAGLQNAGSSMTPYQIMDQLAAVGQKISLKGLKCMFVFSPYYFLGTTINTTALQSYIDYFAQNLAKYDWVEAVQLGNEEDFQVEAGTLLGANGVPLNLSGYYQLYDSIAAMLKTAINPLTGHPGWSKPIMLGLGASVQIPVDFSNLNTNLALIKSMVNIDAVAANLTGCPTPASYVSLLEYIHNQLNKPVFASEVGEPRYNSSVGAVEPAQIQFDQEVMHAIMAQCDTTGNSAGLSLFAFYQNPTDTASGEYYDLSAFLGTLSGTFLTTSSGYQAPALGSYDSTSFWDAADDSDDNHSYFSGYLTANNDQVSQLDGDAAYYLALWQLHDPTDPDLTDPNGFTKTFNLLYSQYSSNSQITTDEDDYGWSPWEDIVGLAEVERGIATAGSKRLNSLNALLGDYAGNIGREARVNLKTLKFYEDGDKGSVEVVENKDNGKTLGTVEFNRDKTIDPNKQVDKLINSVKNAGYRAILRKIASLPGQTDKVYVYSKLCKDLFASNFPHYHASILHQDMLALGDNPVLRDRLTSLVLWHENGHVLMDNEELELTIIPGRRGLSLEVNGVEFKLKRKDARAFLETALRQTDPQQCNHYLLRALSREIFGSLDMRLSVEIKKLKKKYAVSDQEDGVSTPTGGVNLTADWLKLKVTRKDNGVKVSSQASSADFTGWRVIINRLIPVNSDIISRLIHDPAVR